jgi:hypothetical protein
MNDQGKYEPHQKNKPTVQQAGSCTAPANSHLPFRCRSSLLAGLDAERAARAFLPLTGRTFRNAYVAHRVVCSSAVANPCCSKREYESAKEKQKQGKRTADTGKTA